VVLNRHVVAKKPRSIRPEGARGEWGGGRLFETVGSTERGPDEPEVKYSSTDPRDTCNVINGQSLSTKCE